MPERPTVRLPFGGGLDRQTGQTVVAQGSWRDLRNVFLVDGRLEVRTGLDRVSSFDVGWTVIAVHPFRSRSQSAVLVRDPITGDVKLYIGLADGTGMIEKVHILAADIPGAPLFIMADLYNRLFVANDEPDVGLRANTKYFDLTDETWNDAPAIDGVVPAFRGVASWLNYLVGWGWGTGSLPDAPHYLRISPPGLTLPDGTLGFDPQGFFLVGIPGEAITGVGITPAGLIVRKITQIGIIRGTDASSFGEAIIDDNVGSPSHRLGVTAGGVHYFWSPPDGPRSTSGGPSQPLGFSLALLDPPPDLAAADLDTDTGFVAFDPTRKEVLFVFGEWAFVLSILDPSTPKWSYRKYAVPLSAGAILVQSTTGPIGVPPDPSYDFSLGEPDLGPPDPSYDFVLGTVTV